MLASHHILLTLWTPKYIVDVVEQVRASCFTVKGFGNEVLIQCQMYATVFADVDSLFKLLSDCADIATY